MAVNARELTGAGLEGAVAIWNEMVEEGLASPPGREPGIGFRQGDDKGIDCLPCWS